MGVDLISESIEWKALADHAQELRAASIAELSQESDRIAHFSFNYDGMYIDVSKNLVTGETMRLLFELAQKAGVQEAAHAMMNGDKINTTEQRSVLHTALRNIEGSPVYVDGVDVMPAVEHELSRMRQAATAIRSHTWHGATNQPIKTVVNIGIGGSYLGPLMATEALQNYRTNDVEVRFISNIDGDHFADVVRDLDPETTLFIVASKTFTTLETMTSAQSARDWLTGTLGEASVAQHFIALSTNTEAVQTFGIHPNNTFAFWDWVGGRYSLMSAIGLATMIAVGPENFDDMRAGAHAIDTHIETAPAHDNIPLTLALIGVWNRNFLHYSTEAVISYAQALRYFADYLQQANMESNGKTTTKDGHEANYATGPIVWGGTGTDTQHSFFQLIHQGSDVIPVDFIGFKQPFHQTSDHHQKLMANMVAQSEALAFGKSLDAVKNEGVSDAVAPHKVFKGNRPSNTLLLDKLTPYSLGQLIALYEHKIFYQGVVWDINSFDQMGVELGKQLATSILAEINDEHSGSHGASTTALISELRNSKKDA